MSVKPIIKTPDELGDCTLKEFKAKFFKTMKKLAKKHNTPETAAPCYVQLGAQFQDGEGFLLLAGKMNPWKKYAKEHAMKEPALRGYCFMSLNPKGGYELNLMPVVGKIKNKENLIAKAMKKVVSIGKMTVTICKGDFLDNDALDAATESMEDTPDDLEDADGDDLASEEEIAATGKKDIDNKTQDAVIDDVKTEGWFLVKTYKQIQNTIQQLKETKNNPEKHQTVRQELATQAKEWILKYRGLPQQSASKQKLEGAYNGLLGIFNRKAVDVTQKGVRGQGTTRKDDVQSADSQSLTGNQQKYFQDYEAFLTEFVTAYNNNSNLTTRTGIIKQNPAASTKTIKQKFLETKDKRVASIQRIVGIYIQDAKAPLENLVRILGISTPLPDASLLD